MLAILLPNRRDPVRVLFTLLPTRGSLQPLLPVAAALQARGHDVDYAPGVVLAQTAAIVSDGGWLQGASDGRSAAGKAAGY